jgi:hypothetical protein
MSRYTCFPLVVDSTREWLAPLDDARDQDIGNRRYLGSSKVRVQVIINIDVYLPGGGVSDFADEQFDDFI